MQTIRWGFVGIGDIAGRVIPSFAFADGVRVDAAASREYARAEAFAQKNRIPKVYGSYEELLDDPEIDAVYVGTPHPMHEAIVVRALEKGKHVLCEKPMGANAAQVARMIAAARKNNRFLMEANWRRFMPAMTKMRELVWSGAIGDVRVVEAACGFAVPYMADSRLFRPDLAGGAMLDMGIYCLSFAYDMMQGASPVNVTADAELSKDGVDTQTGMLFKYDNGALAILSTSIMTRLPSILRVVGTKGTVSTKEGAVNQVEVTWAEGGRTEIFDCPYKGPGYQFEFMAAADCIRQGLIESPLCTLDQSLEMAKMSDRVRAMIGVKYPFDEE